MTLTLTLTLTLTVTITLTLILTLTLIDQKSLEAAMDENKFHWAGWEQGQDQVKYKPTVRVKG